MMCENPLQAMLGHDCCLCTCKRSLKFSEESAPPSDARQDHLPPHPDATSSPCWQGQRGPWRRCIHGRTCACAHRFGGDGSRSGRQRAGDGHGLGARLPASLGNLACRYRR